MDEPVEQGALEFATPLGPLRVVGPKGPVPFAVTRRDVSCWRPFLKSPLAHFYKLDVPLDGLAVGERYVVTLDGGRPERYDSGEYGQINTATRDGITLGVSAFNPSENCGDWPEGSPESVPEGYSIIWDWPTRHEFAIVKCVAAGDLRTAVVYVAWLPAGENAEDDMSLVMLWA